LSQQNPAVYGQAEQLNVRFSQEWDVGYRAARIEAMLRSGEDYTQDTFAQIQGDNHNLFAEHFLPYVFRLQFDDPALVETLTWLKEWDLQDTIDSPQAAFFAVFWSEIARLTFADQLGYESDGLAQTMLATSQLAAEPDHPWWDLSETTDKIETRDDILREAFQNAYNVLQEQLGPDRTQWRWGDLHTGTFVSRLIGQPDILAISTVLDIGPFPINSNPYPMSGGTASVNATTFTVTQDGTDEPFKVLTAPSFRIILDLSDFANSRAMHTTGQSGHPASGHYDDMIVPWQTIEYHDLRWGATDIQQSATDQLDLRPAPTEVEP
jgi:penicillin amidase